MASVTAIEITVNDHVFRLTLQEATELREQLNLVTKRESPPASITSPLYPYSPGAISTFPAGKAQ